MVGTNNHSSMDNVLQVPSSFLYFFRLTWNVKSVKSFFMTNNYYYLPQWKNKSHSTQDCIDTDDGSSYYKTYGNVFAYGCVIYFEVSFKPMKD